MLRDEKTGRIIAKHDWSDLKELYIDKSLSVNDIAKIKSCPVGSVCGALRRLDIPRRLRSDITPRMQEKFAKNKSLFLKKGLDAKKDKYHYDEILTKELLFDLYINNQVPIRQIALKYGCWYSTIKNRLVKYGIPIRTLKETSAKILYDYRKKGKWHFEDTKIEIKIQNYLKELKIEFFTHQYMSEISHGYQCDIFVPSYRMVIECDGNYWHNYPTGKSIDHIRTSELISKGFKVLRLWEIEIKSMSINDFKKKLEDLNGIQ